MPFLVVTTALGGTGIASGVEVVSSVAFFGVVGHHCFGVASLVTGGGDGFEGGGGGGVAADRCFGVIVLW